MIKSLSAMKNRGGSNFYDTTQKNVACNKFSELSSTKIKENAAYERKQRKKEKRNNSAKKLKIK